jgi:hypothetical protein
MSDNAAAHCADHRMMTRDVARNAAYNCALETSRRVGRAGEREERHRQYGSDIALVHSTILDGSGGIDNDVIR